MTEDSSPKPQKGRIRWGRIFGTLLFFVLAGAAAYGASWLNARRYYLIVDATEVRVGKGRMLPVGHEPFVPKDPALRGAYRSFPLPGGVSLDRGERVVDDRVELDQALQRLLMQAAQHSLQKDDARTPELLGIYLERLRALPGLNSEQRATVDDLERAAMFVEAKGHQTDGVKALRQALEQFKKVAASTSGMKTAEAKERVRRLEGAFEILDKGVPTSPSKAEKGSKTPVLGQDVVVRTTTTATTSGQ